MEIWELQLADELSIGSSYGSNGSQPKARCKHHTWEEQIILPAEWDRLYMQDGVLFRNYQDTAITVNASNSVRGKPVGMGGSTKQGMLCL